eukprot:m.130860 g.130860  ORF g.130860 m.130860 type:complete len:78 (-) comp14610_c0_seq2:9-242(-)
MGIATPIYITNFYLVQLVHPSSTRLATCNNQPIMTIITQQKQKTKQSIQHNDTTMTIRLILFQQQFSNYNNQQQRQP